MPTQGIRTPSEGQAAGREAKPGKARPADGMAEVENADGMSRGKRRSYYEIRDLFLDFVDHGGKQD
ncbi:hypothetical protein BEI59_12300 [Eisenbergiella tayi]|uniref:Uncharacterized protein n=1 Tax=Eisenbergiella tayi TaxID=1432052 RepID=A0A1E3UIU4_9FIRM|nr:hypothetical protein BEI62_00205 [Eisenbergiella tayi]ODR52270.1 hypothetical protein BEI59_12300 [Eisenbergiella tayi]ODR54809.1 hypothetical protein BEI63_17990 [Eisenbergiella tayi]ODR56704.1 hypothetical protein BEI64_19710 [Eisenbergiella tayi]